MYRTISIIMLAACVAACSSHAPKQDAQVKSALIQFVTAVGDGDLQTVRNVAVIDEAHAKAIDAQCAYGQNWKKLDEAAVAKFGDGGRKVTDRTSAQKQTESAIQSAQVGISGDSATVASKELGQPAQLLRVDGRWKVDVARMPGADDRNAVPRYQALARAAADMAEQIRAGRYAIADEASKAWRQQYIKTVYEFPPPDLEKRIEEQRAREQRGSEP